MQVIQNLIVNNYFIPESYIWDKKLQIWKYKNDNPVKQEKLNKIFERISDTLKQKNALLTKKLINNEITLNQWKEQFFRNIKFAEINTFLLKTGGADNVSIKDTKILNNNLKKKFGYFNKFTQDIKLGISEKQLEYRTKRYNESIYSALSTGNLLNKKKTGYQYAYRILGASEHCKDCLLYFSQGVVNIDDFTPVKTNCICQERCKCTGMYFKTFEEATAAFNNGVLVG